MFSEYASRFLAQSGIGQTDEPPRNPNDRYRKAAQRPLARPYQQYSASASPYRPSSSRIAGLPFASHLLNAPPDAPLFHSALDDFEEDEEEERQREDSDFYALQRSRRVFGMDRLEESAESHDSNVTSGASAERDSADAGTRTHARGIKSSWNGGKWSYKGKIQSSTAAPNTVVEDDWKGQGTSVARQESTESSNRSSQGTSETPARMVDIGLESAVFDLEDPDNLLDLESQEASPAPFQTFKGPSTIKEPVGLQRDRNARGQAGFPASISRPSSAETVPQTLPPVIGEPPRHDHLWGQLYMISLFAMLATFILVWLHTSPPGKLPLGDTIYSTLRSSFHLLGVDTLAAIVVGLVWLALLQSAAKPLFYFLLVAVPVILISFSLFPFIESFQGTASGSAQSKLMRWLSFVPLFMAFVWVFTVWKGRHAFAKAVGILEFSGKILVANAALLILGFVSLSAVVVTTWIWLLMFTRVFLGGHISGSVFIIDLSTWWLGIFFIMVYLWTLGMIAGIQRTTTAAVVSQWYFHRNADQAMPSSVVVRAAFMHSITTIFGTIGLSTFLALLIRLPLLVLPRRLVGMISIIIYSFIPTPTATLLSPLALSYAAIRSQPLAPSARALSQMTFMDMQRPTTTLTPRSFSANNTAPLLSYRLAKLLLHATRVIMSMALGFGGWVATARQLAVDMPSGVGVKGSAYAYVVGLVAAAIGWGVLGSIEGVLTGIVDATIVCWGIEKGTQGGGTYCIEAGLLFEEGRRDLPR